MCHNYHSYALTVLNRVSACFFEQIGTRLQRVGYSGPSVEGHWWEVWGEGQDDRSGDQVFANPYEAVVGVAVEKSNLARRKALKRVCNSDKYVIVYIPALAIHLFGTAFVDDDNGEAGLTEVNRYGIKTKSGGVWMKIDILPKGFELTLIGGYGMDMEYYRNIESKKFKKLHTLLAYIPEAYRLAEKWHNTPKKVVLQKRKAA